jgi:hypothetical protein
MATGFLVVDFFDSTSAARGDDWPMWRRDAGRSAVSPQPLSTHLYRQWSRELGMPVPAWPLEQDYHGKLEYDRSYQPIVLGKRIIVPSMISDRVTAFATESGEEMWRYYADGPVRFAPVGWQDRVYFVSDDGYLYCLQAEDGSLLWKVRGGPVDRAIVGNERLISSWPARGAPVLFDGKIYFAAGIWPFMGTFVHAVDATSGELIWTNSDTGAIYNLHQHGGADAFGGVAPQGYLAAQEDHLVVAGGLTVPAVFNRQTGEFLHFEQSHAAVGKGAGGFEVAVHRDWYFNGGKMYSLADGKLLLSVTTPLLGSDKITCLHNGHLVDFASELEVEEASVTDRRGRTSTFKRYSLRDLRKARLPVPMSRLYLQAGNQLLGTSEQGEIVAITWPRTDQARPGQASRESLSRENALKENASPENASPENASPENADESIPTAELLWKETVPGTVWSILAADDRLFVVTEEGGLYCYGDERVEPREHPLARVNLRSRQGTELGHETDSKLAARDWSAAATELLEQTSGTRPYGLVWGIDQGELVEQLLAQSVLHWIVVEKDAERIAALRRRLDDAGLYGRRAHLICADPETFPFPPYLASLVVSERIRAIGNKRPFGEKLVTGQESSLSTSTADWIARLFHPLRPYGGTAWLPLAASEHEAFQAVVSESGIENAKVSTSSGRISGEWVKLERVGALPGAGQWTHQYGNSANTLFSEDKLVKAPLGMLWFGGPSNRHALPRHAQGPIPQVIEGRLIMEGVDSISARCVYTGQMLWIREFPNIGFPYKANNHTFTGTVYINNQPGANFIGSNYVSTPDSIYVVHEDTCYRLAVDSGETMQTIQLPGGPESDQSESWGFVTTWGDYLIAGADPHIFDERRIGEANWNKTSSRRVVVMDRFSGDVLWSIEAEYGFRHNAIVPVDKKLFLIDRLSDEALKLLDRRGQEREDIPRLHALDLDSGAPLWSTTENVFGTWLSYSAEHDVLLQAGRTGGRAHLSDEPSERIIAHRGQDGSVLWDKPIRYTGPLVIHGDQIISSRSGQGSFGLLTGERQTRFHPMTGQELPWTHSRAYGCGTILACENLLTFRSGAAGFFDMSRDGGTGNFGGFRAGCTPNLIPADGVLNAPDYTRTCSCSYQNQTSLALIHQPDIEVWTYSTLPSPEETDLVRRVGINFGAPGDRIADNGTLWMEFPSVAGQSPDIPVRVRGDHIRWFRNHSSLVAGESPQGSHLPDTIQGARDFRRAADLEPVDGANERAEDAKELEEVPLHWVSASGLEGAATLDMTLLGQTDGTEHLYTVRLHFAEFELSQAESRRFDVHLQGRRVLENFNVAAAAGGLRVAVVRQFSKIPVTGRLRVELRPTEIDGPPPVLSGVEVELAEEAIGKPR